MMATEDDYLVVTLSSDEIDILFQEVFQFVEDVRSFEVSEESRLKSAYGEATATADRVWINSVLVVGISKTDNRVPHTKFEDFQAFFHSLLQKNRELRGVIPDSCLHSFVLTLGIHVLDVEADDCNFILIEVEVLQGTLEDQRIFQSVSFKIHAGFPKDLLDRF
jgi:hypothetical protein